MASSTSSNGSSTFDASSLMNGLFTDFAPLLGLFGDEVTKQFLATSMGWGDDILLALAPIGIMTVLVSAIRVSGYPLMKSFIGRARDSPDDEEKDILSSTSENVREIWNGQRIIRQTGTSQTTEYVYTNRRDIDGKSFVPSTWTLQSALVEGNERPPLYGIKPKWLRPWKRRKNVLDAENPNALKGPVSDPKKLSESLDGRSPNLTLNIKGVIPSQTQLWALTSLGVVVQAIAFVFNALAVYYWRWPRAGYVVAPYGYSLWAVGTSCITVGLCLCARVVELCTDESVVEPVSTRPSVPTPDSSEGQKDVARLTAKEVGTKQDDTGTGFRVVRLQKKIPSMNLGAFGIITDEADHKVVISRRTIFPPGSMVPEPQSSNINTAQKDVTLEWKSKILATRTMIGTFLTLAGFICQNLGIRQLHWSAGVAQLVSTLLLVFLRALLRRAVGDIPENPLELMEGHEASHLATHIHHVNRFMIPVAVYNLPRHVASREPCDDYSPDVDSTDLRLLSSEELKISPKLEEPYSNVEPLIIAYRVLHSQLLFQEIQTEAEEVHDIAAEIYDAMDRILDAIDTTRWLEWSFETSLKGTGLAKLCSADSSSSNIIEGILKAEMLFHNCSSSFSGERERQLMIIRTILSLTMYSYFRLRKSPETSRAVLFILGSCQAESIDNIKFQKKLRAIQFVRGQGHYITSSGFLGHWFRGPDRKVFQASEDLLDGTWVDTIVFGMSHSGISFESIGPGKPVVEFVCKVGGLSVLEVFAIDFLSVFLKQLVLRELGNVDGTRRPSDPSMVIRKIVNALRAAPSRISRSFMPIIAPAFLQEEVIKLLPNAYSVSGGAEDQGVDGISS